MRKKIEGRVIWTEGPNPELVRVERGRIPVSGKREVGVVGLDLSLTRAAAVYVPPGWSPIDVWKGVEWKVSGYAVEGKDPREHAHRLAAIASDLFLFASSKKVKHVACEDLVGGLAMFNGLRLAELAGSVKCYFWVHGGIAVRPVNVSSARKTLLGKLPRAGRSKIVHESILRLKPPWGRGLAESKVPADEGDAWTIANHARSLLGFPFASVAVAE